MRGTVVSRSDDSETRLRQPAFDTIAWRAGLLTHESMAEAFRVGVADVKAALRGAPVTPEFIAGVLIAFPASPFGDLFGISVSTSGRR